MILFEWNEAKARSNLRKHGIDFDDATEAFYDPNAVMEQDRDVGGELRWQTMGSIGGVVLLLVAHTICEQGEDEVIRIISARQADRRERRRYEQSCEKGMGRVQNQ